jgi:hypothetical protein
VRLWLLALAALSAAAAWVAAQPTADASPSAVEQLRLLQRNRLLVHALVDGGLDLTARPDPLKRADRCRQLAGVFADEVRQAVRDQEESRAAELGRHLLALVERGVAGNLTEARRSIAAGSQDESRLGELREDTEKVLAPLLDPWPAFGNGRRPSPWQDVQKDLRDARSGLERAVRRPAQLDRQGS